MIIDKMFLYGNKNLKFNSNDMLIEPCDNIHDLTFWEKRVRDYAVFKVIDKVNGIERHKFTIITKETFNED